MKARVSILSYITLALLGFSAACGSSMTSEVAQPRGLIDLNARMPVGQSPYGIAYGAPTRARSAGDAPDIDAYLKPEYANKQAVKRAPAQVAVRRAVKRAAAVAPAPVVVAEMRAPQAAPQQPMVLASHEPGMSDASRYSQREHQEAKAVEQFRGGDAIVITSGALIIILLVVILVLLLT